MHLAVEPEDSFDLVKLLDLGFAALGDWAAKDTAPGTSPYGSPEQAEGQPAEPSSDIYSLGAVFYEMITGTAPAEFLDKRVAGLVTMSCRCAPGAGIDGQLDDIILKCLRKKPRLRFAHTAELCAALDSCVTDCAFLRDAYPARPSAEVSIAAKPSRAPRSSPPPIPRLHPLVRNRAQPPPIPRAWKPTPVMKNPASETGKPQVPAPALAKTSASGRLIPLPHIPRHSAVARGTPPPIPLTSDLLTEIVDQA